MNTRRSFLHKLGLMTTAVACPKVLTSLVATERPSSAQVSFFVVGDTHYCADAMDCSRMDDVSARYNRRLVDWLNRLPGTRFPEEIGGGQVPLPHGVLHAGDIVDNGDKSGAKLKMADTEIAAFSADWGINGTEGLLRWPVREVHGNHDGPRGDTVVVSEVKKRNQKRQGLTGISDNGLHYSWDWGDVHFVALGIVVGDSPAVTRKRRYSPLGSLPFLEIDLAEHVGGSGKPVVLLHHVDVLRYCEPVAEDVVLKHEWDFGDVQAYYALLKRYQVAAAICGHTHRRELFRWNGTKDVKATHGLPFLNTDNGAHFNSESQAILHVQIADNTVLVREFATKDGWETGLWTPQRWKFGIAA